MISTENKLMQKVILVFANLKLEIDSLIELAQNKIYPPLSIFGESLSEFQQEDGEKQLQFGRAIPMLMDLWNFVERVNIVVKNVVQQVCIFRKILTA
jgi:hypothetical protein